jgi:hypothetical protein
MNKPAFPPRRIMVRLGAGALVAVAGAAGLGWSAGETPLPPPSAIPKETWELREIKPEDTAKLVAVLAGRHPWAGFIDSARRPDQRRTARNPAPKPATPWRLAGIVQRGDESFALIATGQAAQTKIEYRRVGDSLPDGSILVQILPDSAKTQPAPSDSPSTTPPSTDDSPPENPETRVYRLFDKK